MSGLLPHASVCADDACPKCGGVLLDEPTSTYACPDCGAPGGAECDDSCPSGSAAYAEFVEADMEEWDHLTPEELAIARGRIAERTAA